MKARICRSLGEEDRLESEGATLSAPRAPSLRKQRKAGERGRLDRDTAHPACPGPEADSKGRAVLSPGGQGPGGGDWSQLSWPLVLPVVACWDCCPEARPPGGSPPPQSDAPSSHHLQPSSGSLPPTPGPPSWGSTLTPTLKEGAPLPYLPWAFSTHSPR